MLGAIRSRIRELGSLTGTGLLVVGILACAASTALRSAPTEVGVIAEVKVDREEGATRILLAGVDHPVFTAFAQQSPERVVVDLASVQPGGEVGPVSVHDGLVGEVTLSPFSTGAGDAMTRVEVSLEAPADYRVVPTDVGLEIRVAPLDATAAAGPGGAATAAAEDPQDPWLVDLAPAAEASAPAAEAVPPAPAAPPATTLVAVEARKAGEGTLVHLKADGSIASAVSFTLEDPARLVIDLPGLRSTVATERVEAGSPHAARVRVGTHEDLVRVVIDGGSAQNPFDGRRVLPAPDGLLVTLGSGEALDRAAAAIAYATPPAAPVGEPEAEARFEPVELAQADAEGDEASVLPESTPAATPLAGAWEGGAAPAAAAAEEPAAGLASIYGVEYSAEAERSRIVVMSAEPFDYLVYEPDPETVILSIEDAVIEPQAAVRVAPDPGGPVSLVTAFAQPDTRTPEVRVVVKRAAHLKPEVSRRGAVLVMDFANTGKVAATPPAFARKDAAAPAAVARSGGAARDLATAAAPLAGAAEAAPPAALEPPAAIGILNEGGIYDGKEYTGRRISLDFKDVEVADVLRLIAEVSDLNVIAGDEVKGKVTIRLVDVPWDQALDVVLLTRSLGFMRVGNVLRIAPGDVLKQEEELRLQERRNLEKLEDLVVKLQPVNYANVKEVSKMVQKLLSARGAVNVDERTNTVIIKDIPSVIDEATALIKAIDTQTPQVMIEAKIVEANLDFTREFGSTWSIGSQPLVDGFNSGSGPRRDLGGQDFRFHDGNNVNIGNPITAAANAFTNLNAFILDEKLNLNLQLQAAEVNGYGKVISSPRVVTLDNSKATIEQGVSIPFQTFENGDAQLEFVDAVLKLGVTPHITADRSIIMLIEVSRNAPDDSVFTLTGSPAIAKNQVKTETLVKDGQTLVLGGIYVVDKSQRQSRVPYVHKIPILGRAFRSDEISDSRKELLIFVSPRVVETVPAAS